MLAQMGIPMVIARVIAALVGGVLAAILYRLLFGEEQRGENKNMTAIWSVCALLVVVLIGTDAINAGPISTAVGVQIGALLGGPKAMLDNLAGMLGVAVLLVALWDLFKGNSPWGAIGRILALAVIVALYNDVTNGGQISLAVKDFILSLIVGV